MSEVPRSDQVILSEERSGEIGVAMRSILLLLGSITEEELRAICSEADKDSAFGPFLDPTAYQSGSRFRLNNQAKMIAKGLLEVKQALVSDKRR